MPNINLANYISKQTKWVPSPQAVATPFITISRQYGCYGYSLGKRLEEALAVEGEKPWRVYNREILETLAQQASHGVELLRRKRLETEDPVFDYLRGLIGKHVPSGPEVRQRITLILRDLAREGHVILVGQGGGAVTADLPGGLSLRFEAPHDWRVRQICHMMKVDPEEAGEKILREDRERDALLAIYGGAPGSRPTFDLSFDCSAFTLEDVLEVVLTVMRRRARAPNEPRNA
jgi:cytidylate kinase